MRKFFSVISVYTTKINKKIFTVGFIRYRNVTGLIEMESACAFTVRNDIYFDEIVKTRNTIISTYIHANKSFEFPKYLSAMMSFKRISCRVYRVLFINNTVSSKGMQRKWHLRDSCHHIWVPYS